MKQSIVRCLMQSVVVVILIPILWACGAHTVQPIPLAQTYGSIFIESFTAGPQVEVVYVPEILKTEAMTIAVLESKNAFRKVERLVPGTVYKGPSLIIRACVTEMRIVSSAARGGFGIMAGPSYMNIEVSIADAITGEVVSKQTISSTRTGGVWANDRSLPTDTGPIIAQHIFEIVSRRAP